MRVSKYINLDANVLMEYIYDDANLISEPYEILVNTKDKTNSFLSTNDAFLNNLEDNLFQINSVSRTYGITNPTNYSFLQVNNFSSGYPLRYDTIVIHLPISYTFGNNIGFYLRVYGYDKNNLKQYDLCNFFYDVTNVNTKSYINYTNPPFVYNETLWGKELTIQIPSLDAVSNQRTANLTTPNSLNFNLTNGVGFNQQSPIFFEFSFINLSQTINGIITYKVAAPLLTNIPQVPEFKQLGVVIEPASDGDYFEIYGIYNGTIAEFNDWINDSVYLGNNYYVTYNITMYEQNIRGNSLNITVTDNFNIPIEFRPIIKYSSTTAIIQVEMNVIDAVSNSSIIRKASYGMLPNEVSQYSRYLTKINLLSATKPKIYNSKNNNGGSQYQVAPVNNITTVSVPFSILVDSANVVAQSDNVIAGSSLYYGEGKLIIILKPFDTYIKIQLFQDVKNENGVAVSTPFDLTSYGKIQLTFKNIQFQYDFPLYTNNGDVDVSQGILTFLVPSTSVSNLRTILQSGASVFYITSTQQNSTSVVYSGLFDMYDSSTNINNLLNSAIQQIANSTKSNLQITTDTTGTTSSTSTTTTTTSTTTNIKGPFSHLIGKDIRAIKNSTIDNSSFAVAANNTIANTSQQNIVITTYGQESGDNSNRQPQVTWNATPSGGIWTSSNQDAVLIVSQSNGTQKSSVTLDPNNPGTSTITYTYNGQSATKNYTVSRA